jgi:CubicO group peptidase (beta-lactamase class C family)
MRLLISGYLLVVLTAPMLGSAQQGTLQTLASQINQVMQTHAAAADFSGSVLVARDGRILYQHAFGYANLEWIIPNDLHTKFEIGSMTKQFTALLVLQFVHEGKIKLDGHLSDYLPYYRKDTGNRLSISQLLSHTSGIPNFILAPGFLEGPASRTKYSVKDFAQRYCSGNLEFEPGTRFNYSNSGYFLLGAVLEQASGSSYEQLLKDRIFTPLDMNDSGYTHSETIIPHRAAGYERSGKGLQNARFYDMSIPFAAGALYSTVGDLLLWDQALYGRASTSCKPARSAFQTESGELRIWLGNSHTETGYTLRRRNSPHARGSDLWIPICNTAHSQIQELIVLKTTQIARNS